MLIVFIVDTSASMNQRTQNGFSALDCAKAAIEHFIKLRGRDPAARTDRYFLVTCEEGINAVKCGWKETFQDFTNCVKNLTAKDLTSLGPAVKRAFDLMNQFRGQSGIDNYGQGRIPSYFEPCSMICLTDGGQLTSASGVQETLTLPLTPSPGSELTMEPFRWDQRLFSIILQMGASSVSLPPRMPQEFAITPMSEVTGGTSQVVVNMKGLLNAVEQIVPRLQQLGVVCNFEMVQVPNIPSPPPPSQSLHKMLYVRPNTASYWPIPESFLPDSNTTTLPPRTAHPVIKYLPVDTDPLIFDNFPFDKYEVEPCALTQYMLNYANEKKQPFGWQVFIAGSAGPKLGDPFGFLRPSSSSNSVSLFVLPYNFPKLWPLLEELHGALKMTPTIKWRQDFEKYLQNIPNYYYPWFRNAMKRFGAPNVVPDNLDGSLNYNIVAYLKKVRQQSKMETDRIQAASKQTKEFAPPSQSFTTSSLKPISPTFGSGDYHRLLQKGYDASADTSGPQEQMKSQAKIESSDTVQYKNVFDINRNNLLEFIDSLKQSLVKGNAFEEGSKHAVPISQMGNYQEVLAKRETLREVDEDRKTLKPALFGNPFKVAKYAQRVPNAGIDEADEEGLNKQQQMRPSSPKRGPPSPTPSSPSRMSKQPRLPPKLTPITPPMSPSTPPQVQPMSPVPSTQQIQQAPTQPTQQPLQQPQQLQQPPPKLQPSTPQPTSPMNIESSVQTTPPGSPLTLTPPKVPKPAAAIPTSPLPNGSLKAELTKLIRKPGKNYEEIFNKLTELTGDSAVKKAFVEEITQEAKRVKKMQLVTQLQSFAMSIE